MTSIWLIIGLIFATISVSTLAAGFSVIGLGALFSGALLAVYAMAGSLEFAKFVLAAYLHRRWGHLNLVFKSYLLAAIVVLSTITSMGIFGFLSDAYQSSSSLLESENIKLDSLKNQQAQNNTEVARLIKSIEDIPPNRITKRIAARAEAEPMMRELNKKTADIEHQIAAANLQILEVKKRVGPLIYIARAFNMDLDSVVKYLIFVFVMVFDPLAICLVIATSEAMNARKQELNAPAEEYITETVIEEIPADGTAPAPAAQGEEVMNMRFSDPNDDRSAG